MSSEASQTRRRAPSNATSLPLRSAAQPQPKPVYVSKSTHTSDEFLQDFLNPSFDAAAYLNSALPPLALKANTASATRSAVPLAQVSTQTQTLLSQLNTHTTRLSTTLTQLTDDILRSGSRLAYEVELLRGEVLGLQETMRETLQEEIGMFVPGGLGNNNEGKTAGTSTELGKADEAAKATEEPSGAKVEDNSNEPAFIKQLQTLTLVRERLDSVIKTFGDAMEFAFPPSEVSVSSSFLSVSAPEPGSEQQSSEDKGQQVLKSLRDEVSNHLYKNEDPVQGIEKALERIEKLKELSAVWDGTAEEKGRKKFIESLAKMVEDRHRELLREMEQTKREAHAKQGRTSETRDVGGGGEDIKALPGGFGLMSQLQKLRSGLS